MPGVSTTVYASFDSADVMSFVQECKPLDTYSCFLQILLKKLVFPEPCLPISTHYLIII